MLILKMQMKFLKFQFLELTFNFIISLLNYFLCQFHKIKIKLIFGSNWFQQMQEVKILKYHLCFQKYIALFNYSLCQFSNLSQRNLVNLELTAGAGLVVLLRIIYWLVSAELYKISGGFGLFWMFHVLVCNIMML